MKRIVLIGDSQAEGLTNPLRLELARRGVGQLVAQATMVGASTRVLLDRGKIRAALEQARTYDLVIFALGGNDTVSGTYPRTLAEAVRALARADGSMPDVVWIGPAYSTEPDVDARHLLVSRAQAQVLPQLGVRWWDSRAWTMSGHAPDGVHFTRAAYELQAAQIVDRVLSRNAVGLAAGVILALVGTLALAGGVTATVLAARSR